MRKEPAMKRWWAMVAVAALGLVVGNGAEAGTYKAEYTNSLVVGPVGPWGEAAARIRMP